MHDLTALTKRKCNLFESEATEQPEATGTRAATSTIHSDEGFGASRGACCVQTHTRGTKKGRGKKTEKDETEKHGLKV